MFQVLHERYDQLLLQHSQAQIDTLAQDAWAIGDYLNQLGASMNARRKKEHTPCQTP